MENNRSQNLIYGLRDPRNDVYKYVGKTTIGHARPLHHLTKSHNKSVNEWVEELSKLAISPIVDIIERDIELNNLSEREKHWIIYYNSIHELFNGGIATESISVPSKISDNELEQALTIFKNVPDIYKKYKRKTGFNDYTIANTLNISVQTLYRLKNGEESVKIEALLKLMFFAKYTNDDVFKFYLKSTGQENSVSAEHYETFIKALFYDKDFTIKWYDRFYRENQKQKEWDYISTSCHNR